MLLDEIIPARAAARVQPVAGPCGRRHVRCPSALVVDVMPRAKVGSARSTQSHAAASRCHNGAGICHAT